MVTGVSAWQGVPLSGTLDISIPGRYVDSSGNATVRHYSGVLRTDGIGGPRWVNALNPNENLWVVVQGPTDPAGQLATFNEILSYGPQKDVRTTFTRRLVSSDLNGLFFDYAQPAPVNSAGFGIEPLTMQAARDLLNDAPGVFDELGVVLADIRQGVADTEQSKDAIAATANSVPYASLAAFPSSSTSTRGAIAGDTGFVYSPGGATWGEPITRIVLPAEVQAAQATADGAAVAAAAADSKASGADQVAAAARRAVSNGAISRLNTLTQADGPQFADGSLWNWTATGSPNGGTETAAGDGGFFARSIDYMLNVEWFGMSTLLINNHMPFLAALAVAKVVGKELWVPATAYGYVFRTPEKIMVDADSISIHGENGQKSLFRFAVPGSGIEVRHSLNPTGDPNGRRTYQVKFYRMVLQGESGCECPLTWTNSEEAYGFELWCRGGTETAMRYRANSSLGDFHRLTLGDSPISLDIQSAGHLTISAYNFWNASTAAIRLSGTDAIYNLELSHGWVEQCAVTLLIGNGGSGTAGINTVRWSGRFVSGGHGRSLRMLAFEPGMTRISAAELRFDGPVSAVDSAGVPLFDFTNKTDNQGRVTAYYRGRIEGNSSGVIGEGPDTKPYTCDFISEFVSKEGVPWYAGAGRNVNHMGWDAENGFIFHYGALSLTSTVDGTTRFGNDNHVYVTGNDGQERMIPNRAEAVPNTAQQAAGANPTAAEYNALLAELRATQDALKTAGSMKFV